MRNHTPTAAEPVVAAARPLALAALLILAADPGWGQERPEEPEVFAGETTVVAVEVPVQVLDGGEPVRGLTAADFVVYDGEERRELTGFEVVDVGLAGGVAPASPGAPASAAVPAAGRRHFLLFFDLAFSDLGRLSRSVDSARKLLDGMLHPSDLVGVALYSDRGGANMALQFTSDRTQVETVLDAVSTLLDGEARGREGTGATRRGDALGLTAGSWDTALVEVGRAVGVTAGDAAQALAMTGGASGNIGGALADNILQHMSAVMKQVIQDQRGAQVAYFTDAVRELAGRLRSIEGTKHIVLFSGGIDARLANPMSTFDPHWKAVALGGGSWILRELNAMVRELHESGWIVHGASLRGVPHPFEAGMGSGATEGLFFLAHETGGMLIENANDVAVGFPEILERTSVTYVLTFQAEDVPTDGSFRPIRVELADRRRDTRLVHRTGYHAPRPPGQADPAELRAEAAARILAGEEISGLPARLLATALDYDGRLARVPVLVEVAEPNLLAGGTDGGAVEVYVYAFDGSGAVVDHFAHAVAPAAAAGDRGEAPLRGLKLSGALALPPGRYELRMLVRSLGTGREAVRSAVLDVPEPSVAGPRLLPPLFVQAPAERWVVAEIGDGGGLRPFTVEGKRIAPAALPALAPGQAVRLLVPGMGIAAAGVRLETRIVDAAGRAADGGRFRVLGRRPPAAGQPDLLVARLDPTGLAPGAYALEVTLAGGGEPVRAPFEVLK